MNGRFASETVDMGSIPGLIKPSILKIDIHCFSEWHLALKEAVWTFIVFVVDWWAGGSLDFKIKSILKPIYW